MVEIIIKGVRQVACLTLAAVLASGSVSTASGNSTDSGKPTIQERILLGAPAGTLVHVRLFSKEKLRGRIAEVRENGFVLQVVNEDRIEQREIAIDEVKKLKVKRDGEGMSTGKMVLLGGLAGAGIAVVSLIVIALAAGG